MKINSFLLVILVSNRAILNQSTTIYYAWIYSSFLEGLKVRSDFLDISNVFDKVWHNGIILKLRKFPKPFTWLFKWKKRTSSFLHGKMSVLEYLKVLYLILSCFWFTLVIWQKTYHLMQSFSKMIRLCFLLYMTLKLLQIF